MSSAIVTGAGRGIGRAISLALAQRGFDIGMLSRRQDELDDAAHHVSLLGRRALPIRCDVSLTDEVAKARDRVAAEFGTPRVLVNNAGIVRRSLIHETSDADWDAVLNVNLRAAFVVTRAFLPSMLSARTGRVIMVSSISATLGTARQASYSASKWGMVGLMKSLAEELRGTGLQTMAVMPGSVDTEMLRGSDFPAQMSAEDVAKLVIFASLDAPDAMNGSAIEMFGP